MKHLPAAIQDMGWLVLILAPAALVFYHLAAAAAASGLLPSPPVSLPRPGCKEDTSMCGNIQIPYPFGISNDGALPMAMSSGNFTITCNYSFNPPKPFLGPNMEVINILLEDGQMVVNSLVASICYNTSSNAYFKSWVNTKLSWPYLISQTSNEFTAIGCDTAALLANKEAGNLKYFTGCISFCASVNKSAKDGDECAGLGCCKTGIVANLDTIRVYWGNDTTRRNNAWNYSSCGYAFVAKKGWYKFSRQDLTRDEIPVQPHSQKNKYLTKSTFRNATIPLVLDWAIRGGGSCVNVSGNLKGPACVSNNSICVNATNGVGYLCNCTMGYKGNPYLLGGCTSAALLGHRRGVRSGDGLRPADQRLRRCQPLVRAGAQVQDHLLHRQPRRRPRLHRQGRAAALLAPYVGDINECADNKNPCGKDSTCKDTDGGFNCQCNFNRKGDGKSLRGCDEYVFPPYAIAAVATVPAVILACFAIILLQSRKQRMLFNKNGGDILKGVGINIFTKGELKAITNSYSERIGGGFFGDVYKGTIKDGGQTQHVAVKCTVTKKLAHLRQKILRCEAPQHEQEEAWKDGFVKEITFQFQIKHPNVVRLIGCCLETDVPILVFEYVSNGSLHDKLHVADKHCSLSLLQRLDIAIGSAQALSHIHSHGEYNHVHGDIKPANILLDENLEAKVSDFGSSKLLSVNKYVEDVATDGNYADPVYYKTGRFTVKSDVYSFGVVLLELITRKTSRYGENRSLPIDFEKSWRDDDQRWSMYDPDILSDDLILKKCLDMVGTLAVECLNGVADKRPTMGDVVVELKKVKSCLEGPIVDEASKHAGSA